MLAQILQDWIKANYGDENLIDCGKLAEHLLTFKQYCQDCQFEHKSCLDCHGNWQTIKIKPGFTPKEGK